MNRSEFPTPAELTAYRLRTKDGLSDEQIAGLLGIARETVNRRIARARAKMRKLAMDLPAEYTGAASAILDRLRGA